METELIAILGLQWGDEGKGKVINALKNEYEIGVRFQGGANAGHTVYKGEDKIILHQIPSAILCTEKEALITCGCVLDLEALINEIEELKKRNINPEGRLFIDERTPLVFDFHKEEDVLENEKKGKIGTTGKGIGPAYRDLIDRKQIKIGEFKNKDFAYRKFKNLWNWASEVIGSRFGRPVKPLDEVFEKHFSLFEKIKDFLTDGIIFLKEKEKQGKRILFEGAQGALLDILLGTYPYVTSSHTITGGILLSTGVPPWRIRRIIGVMKCYTTRVGEGPFPTEEKSEIGEILREKGQEFGATTGRPRRCGWLDLPLLKYAIRITGTTELVITKLDVLSGFKKVKVCTEYELEGRKIEFPPALSDELYRVKPVYKEFEGFEPDEKDKNLRKFLDFIEKETGTKITYISASKGEEIKKVS